MDGKTLDIELRELLQEPSNSSWLDSKSTYNYLFEAACEINQRTHSLISTQSITTVADQSAYTLNADFLNLYLTDDSNRYFIKYNDGSNDYFIYLKDYESIIFGNNTTSVSIPSQFGLISTSTGSNITGTVTSAGALSNGECTLTDSGATFSSSVSVGDEVHNTTDDSHGYILAVTSNTALVTALFGGTDNDWDSSDAYVVVPQGRWQIVLDPPPSTASHTLTVYYAQRPNPVYAPYRKYGFKQELKPALVKYAAWLYKYRDREPNFGDAFYQIFDGQCRKAMRNIKVGLGRTELKISFIKK